MPLLRPVCLLSVLLWCGGRATCANKRPTCPVFAEQGRCETDPTFMAVNCAKTCNLCEEDPFSGDGAGEFLPPHYVEQSTTWGTMIAEKAVDGDSRTASHTQCGDGEQWFNYWFDGEGMQRVGRVKVINGELDEGRFSLDGVEVYVTRENHHLKRCGNSNVIRVRDGTDLASQTYELECGGAEGLGVCFHQPLGNCLSFGEIEVYAEGSGMGDSEEESEEDGEEGGRPLRPAPGYLKPRNPPPLEEQPLVEISDKLPALPDEVEQPLIVISGELPAVPDEVEQPLVVISGELPAVPDEVEQPLIVISGELPAVPDEAETPPGPGDISLPSGSLITPSLVEQSSTLRNQSATLAVDGKMATVSQTECDDIEGQWFQYHFGGQRRVGRVVVVNGKLTKNRRRLDGAEVWVVGSEVEVKCGEIAVREGRNIKRQTYVIECGGAEGTMVRISRPAPTYLDLREVEVYAA